ncbi:MAG TPA: ribosome-associated translation inhibitor RaiA [Bacteroidales bacterium]|jgi:putative sigma-54 modulation protein|nr:ribosome-associated translation inhibitor RaiA [Bacteroidales bacterium]
MNIRINAVRFDADSKLEEFIEKKVSKLARYFDDIINAEVYLKLENTPDLENKITEIKLYIPGGELFAEKKTKSFEESTDIAVDALKQQILKHKEKLRGI